MQTKFRFLHSFAILTCLLATALAGCSGSQSLSASCESRIGTYPVRYAGTVNGRGEVQLSASATQAGVMDVALRLFHPEKPTELIMQINGVGQCQEGLVRAQFGGGAGDEHFKILGGRFIGLFSPGIMNGAFGRWEMDVIELASKEEKSMNGFWQETVPGK